MATSFIFQTVVDDIDRKAGQFVAACVGVAASRSAELTPLEYGTLRNSQFTNVKKISGRWVGTVGYGVYYAKYLNGLPGFRVPTWEPRDVVDKEGPGSNMNAEPQFLDKGFTQSIPEFNRLSRMIFT